MPVATQSTQTSEPQWISLGVEILDRLVRPHGEHLDRSAGRQVLCEVVEAYPGDLDERWSKWLVEAGESLGIRMKVLDGTAVQVADLVRYGGAAVTCIPEPEPTWITVSGPGQLHVHIARASGHQRTRRIRPRGLAALIRAAGGHESARWVIAEPAPAGSEAEHTGDEHAPPLMPQARLWALLRPEWSDIWVVLVFAVFVGLLALATPIAVESLVNTVAFGQLLQPVIVLALILFVFLMFAAAIRAMQTYVVEIIQRRLFARVASDLAWRLPRVHQRAWDEEYGPELVNRFFDVITVQKTAAQLLLDGVALILGTLIGMAVLAFYHPWLLGFDLVLLALIGVTIFVLGRGAVSSSIKESKAKYRTAAWLEELARCPRAFKMNGASAFAAERADALIADYLTARSRHFHVLMRQIVFSLFLQALASTALLGLGGWLVIEGQLTLGQLVAAELIVAIIVGAFARLGKHVESFYDLLASVDKLGHLFDLPLERSEGVLALNATGPAALRLENVSYHYPQHVALWRGLSTTVSPGERVAIVGPSGCGKSTLLDLLYGLRLPSSGHAELDGADLRDLRPDALRGQVGLVRAPEIFHGTLIENVRLERPGITMADVRRALARVGLLDDVLKLPEGLHTELRSSGAPLSTHQMRQLVLARTLIQQPRLLLIDGLLDELSDEQITAALQAIDSNRSCTVVVVTGRKEIIGWCDRSLDLSVGGQAGTHVERS